MRRFSITHRILLVGLASVVLVAARPAVADDGEDIVRAGREMLAEGRYDVARVLFLRAERLKNLADELRVQAGDGLADAHVGLGRIAMARGRYDTAEAEFARALKIRPGNEAAQHFRARNFLARGRTQFTRGQYGRSVRAYTAAIESGSLGMSELGTAYFLRAQALQRMGREGKAALDYKRAIGTENLSPSFRAKAYYARGLYFTDYLRLHRAIDALNRAVEADPRFADAYYQRGRALAIKGRRAEAMADFRRALALDPEKTAARAMLRRLKTAR